MPNSQHDPFQDLIRAYDRAADLRESVPVHDWKKELRRAYLAAMVGEGRTTLIDIGAGTGVHAQFFQENGLDLHCIDLSPVLVEKCRGKGLSSQTLSVLDLGEMDRSFDGAFAFNSLLHIPSKLLPTALSNIAGVLHSGGLFYWGQYGGESREGIYEDDHYKPKRFFSLLDNDQILRYASQTFSILSFNRILLEDTAPLHFQSLLLRVDPKCIK